MFDEGRAATRGVDEDTGADQDIGDPLRATDTDSADTLTYSLDTASDAFFDIDSTTGQLRTEAELDHETRKSYPVNVSISDGKDANGDADPSADSTITVTVLVSDVNEDVRRSRWRMTPARSRRTRPRASPSAHRSRPRTVTVTR